MKILAYCPLNSGNISTSLGTADYSYYFVMQRFLPLLREFGDVEILAEPPGDEQLAQYQRDDNCIYFAFTPPDKAVGPGLCPTVPVFAWEYSTIPDEAFKYPRDNWVDDLLATGSAITHSSFAVGVVREQLGQDYDIVSIPAPLWDACEGLREQRARGRPRGLAGLELNCKVIDSDNYDITNIAVRPKGGTAGEKARSLAAPWNGEPLAFSFARGETGPTLVGFNDAEPWGVWSRSGYPWLMLDQAIEGEVEIEISARGYAHNIHEPLGIELGAGMAYLLLTESLSTHVLRMRVSAAANFLAFHGVSRRAVGMDDPRDIGFGLASLKLRRVAADSEPAQSVSVDFAADAPVLNGFHQQEANGHWTAASRCTVGLPACIAGDVDVRIETFHSLNNANREIDIWLGGVSGRITLGDDAAGAYELALAAVSPTDLLILDNVGVGPSGNAADQRKLGIGVARISLTARPAPRRDPRRSLLPPSVRRESSPRDAVLYTAILNPNDGRKNWEDIITAFVYALRDKPHATLLVKIANEDLQMFYEDIFTFYTRLHPFQCRVVFIHGYLSDEEYQQLVVHSNYIVNASRGEGQCLPLMEFMSSGVPAIAPRNTAMLDYIDPCNAFIVETSPELAYWPHDPRQVYRTYWHRINWQTLYQAFVDSESLFRKSPRAYRKMCIAAENSLEQFCSMSVARGRLQEFISRISERGRR